MLAEAPGRHRAWPRFEPEWTARISSKEVAEVNGLRGGFGTYHMDLSNYGSGIYTVRITNNGETTSRQIVVSH